MTVVPRRRLKARRDLDAAHKARKGPPGRPKQTHRSAALQVREPVFARNAARSAAPARDRPCQGSAVRRQRPQGAPELYAFFISPGNICFDSYGATLISPAVNPQFQSGVATGLRKDGRRRYRIQRLTATERQRPQRCSSRGWARLWRYRHLAALRGAPIADRVRRGHHSRSWAAVADRLGAVPGGHRQICAVIIAADNRGRAALLALTAPGSAHPATSPRRRFWIRAPAWSCRPVLWRRRESRRRSRAERGGGAGKVTGPNAVRESPRCRWSLLEQSISSTAPAPRR